MTERTITITGKDRPELFRSMLRTLVRNDLRDWKLFISIDPGPQQDQFRPICREFLGGVDHELWVNEMVRGIAGNPFHVLDHAFRQGAALNLYLEEDLLIAPDATELAVWYHRHHRPNWLCLNMLCGPTGTAGYLSNPSHPDLLFETRLFNSLGFVMRREEWHHLSGGVWFGEHRPHPKQAGEADWRYDYGWDWAVAGYILAQPKLLTVQPAFARVKHNGAVGVNCRPDFHFRAFGRLPVNDARPVAYKLARRNDLPHAVVSHLALFQEKLAATLALERAEWDLRRQMATP